ncbi:ABC transporter permease [Pseudobacteriovorax antillogorgiicola]|uniref:ABC-2 type transport system permease protein n=1 Tax=Pseudobacteriovorax antillogorgiicola TaxID=1513793 RepID=A0A1Y6BK26_9BACT|nr:ABC transporter permease [Pseudobacteriovorax antillogorgiicola]TCS55479.1 ABC-2 type transport system permease protein [Pseudobacteriovorax antillogorgiicola]SMF11949.1 ABC-2 type transport system permease protein [Pseudobacteriovorax antillogorgiicola]
MKLILIHTQWMVKELLRQPAYLVSTVAFPSLFYMIFAVPESKDTLAANLLLGSFSAFAVFGVIFLQLGVGVAQERSRSWYLYLRTLPLPGMAFLGARFLSAFFFSVLAALAVILLSLAFTPAELSFLEWLKFLAVLLIGGASFCCMGLALGYWAGEKSCLPIGNLIYLPLTFAGGLWKPPTILPEFVQTISEYLPTRHYGELVWASVLKRDLALNHVIWLAGYALLFGVLTYWGYRRDQQARFS